MQFGSSTSTLTVKKKKKNKVNVNMKQKKELSAENIGLFCGLQKPNPSVV